MEHETTEVQQTSEAHNTGMKLQSLALENFRCFEKVQLDLHPQLTVLVGVNGAGKTALLDALGLFLEGLSKSRINRFFFTFAARMVVTQSEQRNKDKGILFNIQLANISGNIPILYGPDKEGLSDDLQCHLPQKGRNYEEILTRHLKQNATNNTDGMSVFLYYRAQRQLSKEESRETGQKAAFVNAFTPQIDYTTTVSWFNDKEANEARERTENPDFRDPALEAIRNALTLALEGYEKPIMRGTPPVFYIHSKENGIRVPVAQLSDGYKMMLALIMDLSRRMAQANGELYEKRNNKVLHSPAVVLIDEIELHLHPKWQQTVLPTLMKIFPNTQFVVTTHSPQVLTSIKPEHIRIVDNGSVRLPTTSSYGAPSWRVLEDLLGVSSRPSDNEAKKALDEYFALINQDKASSERAKELRKQLDEWMYGDSELEAADMLILRKERAKKRQEEHHA